MPKVATRRTQVQNKERQTPLMTAPGNHHVDWSCWLLGPKSGFLAGVIHCQSPTQYFSFYPHNKTAKVTNKHLELCLAMCFLVL
jgi:hypothetical protein